MEGDKPANSLPQKSGLDKFKKIFRAVIELSKRLDEIRRQKPVGKDVFTSEAISLRHRLRDLCMRLMFQQPVTFGRRAQDILWRKAFYDIIHLIRHSKKNLGAGSALEASYRSHLRSATGFYQCVLLKLQREFGLQISVDVPSYTCPRTTARSWSGRAPHVEVSADAKAWAEHAAHRTLICLGDIARYNQEWSPDSSYLPLRYYHQALAVSPEEGFAHNQIGTLCGNKHYGIHAAYRYMRSLTCPQPFEGAEGNLKRLLEKNSRRVLELPTNSAAELSAHAQQHRDIKTFLVHFLRLMQLFEEHSDFSSVTESKLQQQCHSVLHLFNSCLFYLPPLFPVVPQQDQAPSDCMVFELVTMSIMTVHRLQLKQSAAIGGALAFLLALFSHLLNHCVLRLQALYEGKREEDVEDENVRSSNGTQAQSEVQMAEKPSKRITNRRMRRRRAQELDLSENEDESEVEEVLSSDSEDDWISSDDQLSSDSDTFSVNLDNTPKKTSDFNTASNSIEPWKTVGGSESFGALTSDAFSVFSQHLQPPTLSRLTSEPFTDHEADHPTDESEERHIQEITQKMADFVFDTDTETALPSDLEKDYSETETSESYSEEEQLSRVLQAAGTDSCLKAVKIMCDWLTAHPNIIASAAQSSLALWSRLAVLLNCLPRETDLAKPELYVDESLLAALQAGVVQEFNQHVALSEDVALRSFPPLHSLQQSIDFSLKHLDSQPQAVIRICCLRKFGYMLAAMPGVDFQYDTEQGLFVGPQHKTTPSDHTQPTLDQDQRRGQLMRDMAQLRLQAEVSRLESSLQQGSAIPAYLVTDSSALLEHTAAVRRLVASKRCILVIPDSAISILDFLKAASPEAREVIRWLETEFRKGNRHLRAQRPHEEVAVGIPRGLKKTEPQAWQLLVGLSCALYLRREAGGRDEDTRGLVAQLCVLPEQRSPTLAAAVDALSKEGMMMYTPGDLLRALGDKANDVG